ncbi:hypothetical protein WG909_06710 [Peptostreptococcaceae bacterium AGR-M142]
MKKSIVCIVFLIVFSCSFIVCANESYTKHYNENEIKEQSLKKALLENKEIKVEKGACNGSFIVKYPVRYKIKEEYIKYDAFPLCQISFDTQKEMEDIKLKLQNDYISNINWVTNLNFASNKEFDLIKESVLEEVVKISMTTNSLEVKMTKTIEKNKKGYCEIFAHGVFTKGIMTYKWTDITGNEGYINKEVIAILPLKDYNKYNIHFGNITYRYD